MGRGLAQLHGLTLAESIQLGRDRKEATAGAAVAVAMHYRLARLSHRRLRPDQP